MKIDGRFESEIDLTPQEEQLLLDMKELFKSKSDYGIGADFRVAFIASVMDGYCDDCGNGGDSPCYCTRDD